MMTRRAAVDEKLKDEIKQKMLEVLQSGGESEDTADPEPNSSEGESSETPAAPESDGNEQPEAGDEEAKGDAPSGDKEEIDWKKLDEGEGVISLLPQVTTASRRFAIDFDTKNQIDTYLEAHPDADRSLHHVKEQDEKAKQQDDQKDKQKPKQQEDQKKKPYKIDREVSVTDHPAFPAGEGWEAHKLHPTQLTKNVVVRFPDGTAAKVKDLTPEQKAMVDKAIEAGRAASAGLPDYNKADLETFTKNVGRNLSRYDNPQIKETKSVSKEPVSKENAKAFAGELKKNATSVIDKFAASLSDDARPRADKFVEHFASAVEEAANDGSLGDVSQEDLDEFLREDVKRMLHQEVEQRRRPIGDHGVRHVAGNCESAMQMMGQLSKTGSPINGIDKVMVMSVMANHDIGYTMGAIATDATKGSGHKDASVVAIGEETDRYAKLFGKDGFEKYNNLVATHDSSDMDWDKEPVASAVRLADNTALFGTDKVQELFIRKPETMETVCKLRLAAEMEPPKPKEPEQAKFAKPEEYEAAVAKFKQDKEKYESPEVQEKVKKSKQMQDANKNALHEHIDGDNDIADVDKDLLHRQVSDMIEGKFSVSADVLSRYSGRLNSFEFDKANKMMNVNMTYSPDGEIVDSLFGDEVAERQFDKFTKDMKGKPVKGKTGSTQFSNKDGKAVTQLNIDGVDKSPVDSAATEVMKSFLKKTGRHDLRAAAKDIELGAPGAVAKARHSLSSVKEKMTEQEFRELMDSFDQDAGNPSQLASKLKQWPLFQSEMEYLTGKAASMSRRGARGLQVNRKDRDLISDTGGTSKKHTHDVEQRSPREDVKKPWRTKTKTDEQRDKDIDGDPDMKLSSIDRDPIIAALREMGVAGLCKVAGPQDIRWQAVLFIGPAGSGKSWLRSKRYMKYLNSKVVDPDEIKQAHPEYDSENPGKLHDLSKQISDAQYKQIVTSGTGDPVIVDGTGRDPRSIISKAQVARAEGYRIFLIYAWVPVEVSLFRNRNRPRFVPEDLILEQSKSIVKSFGVLKGIVDKYTVIPNYSSADLSEAKADLEVYPAPQAKRPPRPSDATYGLARAAAMPTKHRMPTDRNLGTRVHRDKSKFHKTKRQKDKADLRMTHEGRAFEAGIMDVLQKAKNRFTPDTLGKILEKLQRFVKTKSPADDLSNAEVKSIYGPYDYGQTLPMSKKRDVEVDWSSHAEYRSDLRGLNSKAVNESVRDWLSERLKTKGPDSKQVRMDLNPGTAVVDYDLRQNPAAADLITVWASRRG